MKRKLLTVLLGIVMIFSLTVAASASWSAKLTLDVPGWNGSKISKTYATKTTDDEICAFHTYTNTAVDPFGVDGRLVNSEDAPRSNWVRNMPAGSTLTAGTSATKGYWYYAELSTDFLEPNTISVSFKFNPDNQPFVD